MSPASSISRTGAPPRSHNDESSCRSSGPSWVFGDQRSRFNIRFIFPYQNQVVLAKRRQAEINGKPCHSPHSEGPVTAESYNSQGDKVIILVSLFTRPLMDVTKARSAVRQR